MKWVYVIVIFVFLIFSQNAVDCYENVGVKFHNLTRLPKNGTCSNNCKYYMNLCLSFSENLNCSLFNYTTLSWEVKPEESKKFEFLELLTDSDEFNPLRPLLKTWKMQEVVLLADIWRSDTTPIFIEQLRIQARLPYPIDDLAHMDRLQIKNCGVYFCLGVSLYMWCDNIAGCIGIPLHTTTVAAQPSFTSHSLSSLTSSAAHPQNTSEIYKRMTTIETMMTSKPYETRTTWESSKSLNMYTSVSASAGSVSTTYGTSSLVVTTSTYKTTTGVEPSKSVFVPHTSYHYKTTSELLSPNWQVVTSFTSHSFPSVTSSAVHPQYTSKICKQEASLHKSNDGTEWYIIVITLVSGIIIGILLSYIFVCSRRRYGKGRKPQPNNQPGTSKELDLSKINSEDNYQLLRVANSGGDNADYEIPNDSTHV